MRSHRRRPSARSAGRVRRKVWVNFSHITAALASGGYEWDDILNAGGAPIFSDAGCTVLRTHLVVTPTSTPALGDSFILAVGVIRNSDEGVNVVGATSPTQVNYPWSYQRQFAYNAGYTPGGGNSIELDLKSLRKVANDFDAYCLGIQSGATATTAYRIWARTLIALP